MPNSSFEVYENCPDTSSQIYYATPWFSLKDHKGSPDYLNACNTKSSQTVPSALYGPQKAHKGEAYIGLITYYDQREVREYAVVKLKESLTAGKTYNVGLFASYADAFKYGTDQIGIYLSNTLPEGNNDWSALNQVQPQISSPQGKIMKNMRKWGRISGSYIAEGGEVYLIIGNFSNDTDIKTKKVNPSGMAWAYYFIDDVFVKPIIKDLKLDAPDRICLGEKATLSATGADRYTWIENSNPEVILSKTPSLAIAPEETTTYTLKAESMINGFTVNKEISFTINVDEPVVINLGPDRGLCIGSEIELDPGIGDLKVTWQDNSRNNTYLVESEGIYSATYTNACGTSKDNVILINENCNCDVFIPNAFTPNDDGANDVFLTSIPDCEISDYRLEVYSQHGEKLFKSKSITEGWDGTFEATKMPAGIYVYKLSYQKEGEGRDTKVGGTIKLHY